MTRLAFLLICLMGPAALWAQDTLSVIGAVQRALSHNYQARIARANADVARRNNVWGAAGRYPTVNLTINDNNQYQYIKNPTSFVNGDLRTYGVAPAVEAVWVLFNGFRVQLTKERLELLQGQAEGLAEVALHNTVQAVLLAYYQALIEQSRLRTFEAALALSQERYKYVESKKAFGVMTQFDVLQAQTAVQTDQQNVAVQKFAIRNALLRLNLLMGEAETAQFALADPLPTPVNTYNLPDLRLRLDENNPNLRTQYIGLKLLEQDVALREVDQYPRIESRVGGNYIRNGIQLNENKATTSQNAAFYANFVLTLNLFNGGTLRRNIAVAELQQRAGQLTLEEMKLTLQNNLATQLEAYNARLDLMKLRSQSVASYRDLMAITDDRFRSGLLTSLDYRQIQQQAVRAEQDYLDAAFQALSAEVELMRLTGELLRGQ